MTDPSSTQGSFTIKGNAYALFAFDIGFQIDLDLAEQLVDQATRLKAVRSRRPAPVWFDYSPAPIRLILEGEPIKVGDRETESGIELLVYDFGAALLTYKLPLVESIDALAKMSIDLYEHTGLEHDARQRAEWIMTTMRSAIERPALAESFEDYSIFAINEWDQAYTPAQLLEQHRNLFARAIEAEQAQLSDSQAMRSTQGVISYTTQDLAIIDWNASVLFDPEPDDVIAVLQHANVELLELRVLDKELDSILDHADETLAMLVQTRVWPGFASNRMLGRFASVQTDAAVMFEGVNNAIKLLGNQYLARVYRVIADRLDLPSWHASVERKLDVTESLYQKMSDATSTRRLETLEWVIIVLIALSMILPFTPWYH